MDSDAVQRRTRASASARARRSERAAGGAAAQQVREPTPSLDESNQHSHRAITIARQSKGSFISGSICPMGHPSAVISVASHVTPS